MTDERKARAQVERWGDMVWRLALARTRHIQDSEDVFQEVFARFFRHEEELDSDEHRKAWLIRCTLNCTNTLLSARWRTHLPLEEAVTKAMEPADRTVYEAVLSLPKKYRTAIHLHYYEGYSAPEIGRILKKNTNTVYTLLARARQLLKTRLEGVIEDE